MHAPVSAFYAKTPNMGNRSSTTPNAGFGHFSMATNAETSKAHVPPRGVEQILQLLKPRQPSENKQHRISRVRLFP